MSQTKAQLVAPVGVVTATGMTVTGVLTATTSFDGTMNIGSASSIAQGKNLNVGIVTASGIAGDITGSATSITQGTNVTFGSLTATFVGDFTGTASSIMPGSNVTAGIVTASSFSGPVTGNLTGNLTGNVTGVAGSIASGSNLWVGVATATSLSGDVSNLSGISTAVFTHQTQITTYSIDVTSPAGGNYTLSGTDRNGAVSGSDPTVTVEVGDTLNFVVDASGHPFYIRVSDGGANVSTPAATNQGTQSGTVSWTPNTAGTYYYQCGNHAGMIGTITVSATTTIDLSAGNIITFNQSADTTVSLANTAVGLGTTAGMGFTLIRTTDATATPRTITWPSNILWTGAADPKLLVDGTGEESQIFKFLTRDSGATWFGWEVQQHSPEKHGLWAWGMNEYGALGVNYVDAGPQGISLNSPRLVGGSFADTRTWQRVSYEGRLVSTTYISVLAQKTDGTLWAWGYNNYGQLGLNNKTSRSSPCQVGTETTWAWAEMGGNPGAYCAVAVKTDGTLWCWGENKNGQLGQNNKTDSNSPKQVGTSTDWDTTPPSSTRTSGEYCIVQKTDGSLWSWGNNESGVLGLNQNDSHRSSPAQIPGNWDYLSVGHEANAAIKSGKLYTWGQNAWGLLGQTPSTTERSSPRLVGTNSNWSKIHISGRGCIATKTDGTLWTWGANRLGALGQNDSNPSAPQKYGAKSSPVQIPGTWTNIHRSGSSATITGSQGYIAVKDDKLWMWGAPTMGFNNVGAYGRMSSPIQILGISSTSVYDAGTCPGPYGGYFITKATVK